MTITNNGTLIEITGTEVGISGLAGGTGVTVEGDVYTVGSPITEFRITGDLTVSDYETLQIDDSVMFSRPDGGVLTMKPFSAIEIIGNPRGADIINNTFRGGFTFNSEILELGGGRIQAPVFREAPSGRSDCFSCYSPDFDSGTGGGVTFNIQGLILIYEPVTSAKLYATASSQLDNIHLKRFGGNFVELQVGFNNGAETKTFDKLIFDNVEQLSTRGGNTQVGSLFLLTTPRYLFPNDFTISFVNVRSDVEFVEIRDIESIGTGQWDGTITNTFRGVRTTSTQKRTYLSGSTPVENIKTVYTPAGSIGSEIIELSDAQGVTEQVLTYGEIQPSGVFFTGVIPQETWTVVAVGYNQRIAGASFRLLDNASPETSDEGLQVVNAPVNEIDKSVVDAYTQIQNANELHDASVAFVVDNPVGLTDWLLTQSGDTIDAGSFNVTIDALAGSAFAFDGSTITINSSAFTGNITTTGTVTLLNGSTISGGIIDSNGDSFLSFTADWEVYATEADRNISANLLDSGTASEIYRFNFVPSTTYYMWVAGTKQEVTPAQSGETAIDLSTSALLVGINDSLSFIPQVIYVDTAKASNGVGSASSPFNNLDDAVLEFNKGQYTFISLRSTVSSPAMPTASLAGTKIQGVDKFSVMDFNGQSLDGCTVENLLVYGTQSASDTVGVIIENSRIINDVTNLKGIVKESEVVNPTGAEITISIHTQATLLDSSIINGLDVTFDLTSSGFFGMRGCDGPVVIDNMTFGTASFEMNSGEITFSTNCTGGAVRLNDTLDIIDNSNGTTLDVDAVTLQQLPTSSEIVTSLQGVANDFKADVSGIPTNPLLADDTRLDRLDVAVSTRASQESINNLNNFNPATDTVARVTLVDTTTANTDMRGTNDALLASNYIAPDTVWDSLTANHVDVDSFGKLINDFIDAPISAIATTTAGGSLSKQSASFTLTSGIVTSGTHPDTHTTNGVYHVITDDAGTLDVFYEFNIFEGGFTNAIPVSFTTLAEMQGNNDRIGIFAYNFTDMVWDEVGFISGENHFELHTINGSLFADSVGSQGEVRIRFFATGLTGSTLSIDQLLVGYTTVSVAPDNDGIASILEDTNELQQNQGNWLTATGFSTFNPATDTVARVTLVDTTTTNADMRGTDGANTVTPPTTAEIEGALLNEGDGQQFIDALVAGIGNQNVNEAILIASIRSDLERAGGLLDSLPLLSEIEASNVLAKKSDISGLNNITASDVWNHTTRTVTGGTIDTNVDMRGTDNALLASNYTAPSNTSIASILADTNELQQNQNNWLTVNKSDLALEATSQSIVKNTNLIPATL